MEEKMPNYLNLTEDQLALQKLAQRIAVEKVQPLAAECDREARFPTELVPYFADSGFY